MANQDRNNPAQPGGRKDMDDERMRGTDDVRDIADESDEEFKDTQDPDEDDEEEEEDEGTF